MTNCGNRQKGIEIRLFSGSGELSEEWNDFVPDGHFLQSSRLKIAEQSSLPDLGFSYALVYDNNRPVLAAGFQLLSLKPKHVNRKMTQAWKFAAWQLYTFTARPKLLVSGHLFRHDIDSVFCGGGVSGYDIYKYYKAAIDAAMRASCATALLVKDMPARLDKYFNNYEPGYIMLRNDISMEMDISADWHNMDDYVQALKHKYAQRYRKISERWHELNIKQLSNAEVVAHKNELFALYRQVSDNQRVRIGLLSPDFIPMMQQHDERLKVWGIYEQNKLIGFFSAWVYNDRFDMFYIGFDYEKNKEYNLYFNILFFAINKAITYRKPKLILGRTALDAKARLGCKPRYLSTFVYIKNSVVRNRIMQTQKNTAANEGAWENKHPFRKNN